MRLVFDESAWEDYLWRQQQDRKVLRRINLLIQDVAPHGNEWMGKPEPLKHGFHGHWSRRITDEHRLIYSGVANTPPTLLRNADNRHYVSTLISGGTGGVSPLHRRARRSLERVDDVQAGYAVEILHVPRRQRVVPSEADAGDHRVGEVQRSAHLLPAHEHRRSPDRLRCPVSEHLVAVTAHDVPPSALKVASPSARRHQGDPTFDLLDRDRADPQIGWRDGHASKHPAGRLRTAARPAPRPVVKRRRHDVLMASHWSLPATRALTAYLVLALANLVAIAVGASLLSNWTQWLLMPVLTIAFLALARGATGLDRRLRAATLAALGFSWLGDLLPHLAPDSVAFLVMVGCFLLAQVAYIVGFLPQWRRSVLVTARPLAALYAVVFVALIAACAGGAGPLLGPVVVYGLSLTAMAVLATGLGRLTGLGGALFMLSDSLIALKAFREWDGRALSMAVMGTYAAAEALLVMGIVRQTAPPVTH